MIVFPNAKINIGLNITEKRSDGYHNLISFFYPVGWSDVLEINPSDELTFQCEFRDKSFSMSSQPGSNLCEKAFDLLKKQHQIPPVSIHLLKSIPIGAGLGGGSSDAAFTLKSLNELFHLGISTAELCQLAGKLGSDCPFFIENKPTLCTGKGDEFSTIEISLKDKWIILVNPGIAISTAEAYSGVVPTAPLYDLRESLAAPVSEWKQTISNDFELSLFPRYPILQQLKNQLYDLGATYASMSGSGSTMYGIFEDEPMVLNKLSSYTIWKGKLL
jgi:4-diphosphocytidyl-2-C-methyl-D-erythritol kinase